MQSILIQDFLYRQQFLQIFFIIWFQVRQSWLSRGREQKLILLQSLYRMGFAQIMDKTFQLRLHLGRWPKISLWLCKFYPRIYSIRSHEISRHVNYLSFIILADLLPPALIDHDSAPLLPRSFFRYQVNHEDFC